MKNNKGFSLVELIVVIAIMAILAAVAVIGVSVYIPKAQKAADQQLVSDIVYAIKLRDYETQFASNNNRVMEYVVITEDGVKASGENVIAALKAIYGENYETSSNLKLSYDGWTDTIVMLQEVGAEDIKDYIGSVNDSTYINDVGTDKLLEDVQNCTTHFGQFLGDLYGGNNEKATQTLISGFGDSTTVTNLLAQAGYADGNYKDISKEALQNITVFAVASSVKKDKQEVIENFGDLDFLAGGVQADNSLDDIATWYAAAEALVAYLGDPNCTDAFSKIDMTGTAIDIANSMGDAYNAIADELNASIAGDQTLYKKYDAYYKKGEDNKSQAIRDGEAYVAIMSSVSNLRGDYLSDQSSVQNSNLFADGSMNNRVNTYIAAANLADEIRNDTQLQNLLAEKESAVVVIARANNGVLECLLLPAGITD